MNTTDSDLFNTAATALREYIDERIKTTRVSLLDRIDNVVKRIERLETQLDSSKVLDRVLADNNVSQFSISLPEQHTHTMLAEGDRIVLPNGKTYRVSKMPNGKLDIAFTGKIEQEKAA